MKKFHIKLFLFVGFCFFVPLFSSENALGKRSLQGLGDQGGMSSIERQKACVRKHAVLFDSRKGRDEGLLALRNDLSDAFDRCGVDEGSAIVLMAQHKNKREVQIALNPHKELTHERIELDGKAEDRNTSDGEAEGDNTLKEFMHERIELDGKAEDDNTLDGEAEVLLYDNNVLIHSHLPSQKDIGPFMNSNMPLVGLPKPVDNGEVECRQSTGKKHLLLSTLWFLLSCSKRARRGTFCITICITK